MANKYDDFEDWEWPDPYSRPEPEYEPVVETSNLPVVSTGAPTNLQAIAPYPASTELSDALKKLYPQQQTQQKTYTVPSKITGTTTSWIPSGEMPQMGEIPEFETPEWNEEEITRLTQKRAAPGIRRLRSAIQQAMGGVYESPQIKRMTLREALAGYGMGLESVMGGAGREATSEYGQKYGREFEAQQIQWQADVQRLSQMYNAAMQSYMKGGEQVTKYTYGSGTPSESRKEGETFISPMTGHELRY